MCSTKNNVVVKFMLIVWILKLPNVIHSTSLHTITNSNSTGALITGWPRKNFPDTIGTLLCFYCVREVFSGPPCIGWFKKVFHRTLGEQ